MNPKDWENPDCNDKAPRKERFYAYCTVGEMKGGKMSNQRTGIGVANQRT